MVRQLTDRIVTVLKAERYEELELPTWYRWEDIRQLLSVDASSTSLNMEGKDREILHEAADLLFHMMPPLMRSGLSFDDVLGELCARWK